MTSLSDLPPPPLLPHEEEEELRRLGRDRRRQQSNLTNNHDDENGHNSDDTEETLSASSRDRMPDSDPEPDIEHVNDVLQNNHQSQHQQSSSQQQLLNSNNIHKRRQVQHRRRTQSFSKGPTDDEEAAAALLLYCHNTMQNQSQAAGGHLTPTKPSVPHDSVATISSQTPSGVMSGLALLAGAANQPSTKRTSYETFYASTRSSNSTSYPASSHANHHHHHHPHVQIHTPQRKVHIGLPYQDHNYGAPPPPTPPASPPPFLPYEEVRTSPIHPHHQNNNISNNNHQNHHHTNASLQNNNNTNHTGHHFVNLTSNHAVTNRVAGSSRASSSVISSHFSSGKNHHMKNSTVLSSSSLDPCPERTVTLTRDEKGLLRARQQKKRRRKELELAVQQAHEKSRSYEEALAKLDEANRDWKEGESSITRCICGFNHDDEFMTCCDECGVWQHVECMFADRSKFDADELYYCEKCRPRRVDRARARALQLRKKDKLSPLRNSGGGSKDADASHTDNDDHMTNGFVDVGRSDQNITNGLAKKHLNRRLLKSKQDVLKNIRGRANSTKGKMKENKGQRGLKSPQAGSTNASPTTPPNKRPGPKNGKLAAKRKLLASDALAKLRSGAKVKTVPNRVSQSRAAHVRSRNGDVDDDDEDDDDEDEDDDMEDEIFEKSFINQYTPEVQILTLRGNSAVQETLLKRIVAMQSTTAYRVGTIGNQESRAFFATSHLDAGFPVAEVTGRFMIMDQFVGNRKNAQPHVLFYSPTGKPLSNADKSRDSDSSDDEEDDDFEETLCVDSRRHGNETRVVRRSCHPNAELRHVVRNGLLQLWIVAGPKGIKKDDEITIGFELPPSPGLDCACGKSSCKLNRVHRSRSHLIHSNNQNNSLQQREHREQQQTPTRPKKLSISDRKPCSLRSTSPIPPVSSPITPITHKVASPSATPPVAVSPVKEKEKERIVSPARPSSSAGATPLSSPLATIKIEKEDPDDMIEVDEATTSSPADPSSNQLTPGKSAAVRRRRTSSLIAEVAIKQEAIDDMDIKCERSDSQDGMNTTTAHSGEGSSDRSERKMTREERKLDAIMKAFEKMEQKQKRKQQAAEHRTPGKEPADKRRLSLTNNDGSSDERPPSTCGGPASSKKGRRKSASNTPMKRGRARTISGSLEPNQSSNDCFAQPAKSKRLLMQGWLQEKHNGASDMSGGDSPSHPPAQKEEEESVCFVRDSHTVGDAMAHLRRSNSLSTALSAAQQGSNLNCATGAGSAKKRWLRQAMFDDGDSTPEAHSPSNAGSSNSASLNPVTSEAPNTTDEDNAPGVGDYVTPLKKRRLMRESIDSSSPNHDCSQREDSHEDEESKDPVVDVVDVPEKDDAPKDPGVLFEMNQVRAETMECTATPIPEEVDSMHTEPEVKLKETKELADSPLIDNQTISSAEPPVDVKPNDDKEEQGTPGNPEPAAEEVQVTPKLEPKQDEKDPEPLKVVSSTTKRRRSSVKSDIEHSEDKTKVIESKSSDNLGSKDEPKETKKGKETKLVKETEPVKSAEPPKALRDTEKKTNVHSKDLKPKEKEMKPSRRDSRSDSNKSSKDSKSSSKLLKEQESKSREVKKEKSQLKAENSSNKKQKDKPVIHQSPVEDEEEVTVDHFAQALILKEDLRKQREKDKASKDKKDKNNHHHHHHHHRKEKKEHRHHPRSAKERSSVDEPVEVLKPKESTDSSPKDDIIIIRNDDAEEEKVDVVINVVPKEAPSSPKQAETPQIVASMTETKPITDVECETQPEEVQHSAETETAPEPSGESKELAVDTEVEPMVVDGSTTPTMDEMEVEDAAVLESALEDAPIRLPPADALKAPSTQCAAPTATLEPLKDRKKKVSLSEYLKRQRSEPTGSAPSTPTVTNNNTILRPSLNSAIKLAPISDEMLGNFAKITGTNLQTNNKVPAAIMGRSKSICDPTSPIVSVPSTIRSSLPASVTAPPMQLLTPGRSGATSPVLHKTALFPDTPERDRNEDVLMVESPQSKREPLSQRLEREFGLCADNNSNNEALSSAVPTPAAYPSSSFPTALVQTPNGPQQVFYVPQTSSNVLGQRVGIKPSLSPMGTVSPTTLSTLSAGPRTYLANGPHHGKSSQISSRPRANTGGAGAGYKPGFY